MADKKYKEEHFDKEGAKAVIEAMGAVNAAMAKKKKSGAKKQTGAKKNNK